MWFDSSSGSETDGCSLFPAKPLDTNMVICCTEKLCGRTNPAPHGAHPLCRLLTASKQKLYQSEKRKVIRRTTASRRRSRAGRAEGAGVGCTEGGSLRGHHVAVLRV